MTADVRRRVVVSGRVQGVFYRSATAETARGHGVSGSVRNLADGRVEAVFQGSPEAVESCLAWCRKGPGSALVTGVDVTDEPPVAGEEGFRVVR